MVLCYSETDVQENEALLSMRTGSNIFCACTHIDCVYTYLRKATGVVVVIR